MKHYAGNHAKKDLGIHNLLQINRLQLREARKSGSNGFPAGSGGFPARWGGFQSRSRGFPAGSNALRMLSGHPENREKSRDFRPIPSSESVSVPDFPRHSFVTFVDSAVEMLVDLDIIRDARV